MTIFVPLAFPTADSSPLWRPRILRLKAVSRLFSTLHRPISNLTPQLANEDPDIEPIYSNLCIDSATRAQWTGNNMAAIQKKRDQAKADLQPIYDNVSSFGTDAWVLVESNGQRYYLSYSDSATMWVYVQDQPSNKPNSSVKDCVISYGSYSVNSNILGISGYKWYNIPVRLPNRFLSADLSEHAR